MVDYVWNASPEYENLAEFLPTIRKRESGNDFYKFLLAKPTQPKPFKKITGW